MKRGLNGAWSRLLAKCLLWVTFARTCACMHTRPSAHSATTLSFPRWWFLRADTCTHSHLWLFLDFWNCGFESNSNRRACSFAVLCFKKPRVSELLCSGNFSLLLSLCLLQSLVLTRFLALSRSPYLCVCLSLNHIHTLPVFLPVFLYLSSLLTLLPEFSSSRLLLSFHFSRPRHNNYRNLKDSRKRAIPGMQKVGKEALDFLACCSFLHISYVTMI